MKIKTIILVGSAVMLLLLATATNDFTITNPAVASEGIYIESISPEREQLHIIIEGESNWRPEVCNVEFGCYAGMGLAMFIPSTWEYVGEKMGGRENNDPFNARENYTRALWLIKNEGSYHWNQSKFLWDGMRYEDTKNVKEANEIIAL